MFNSYFKLPEGTLSAVVDILREDVTSNLFVVSIDPNSQSFRLKYSPPIFFPFADFGWHQRKWCVLAVLTDTYIILIASWHFEPPGQFSH